MYRREENSEEMKTKENKRFKIKIINESRRNTRNGEGPPGAGEDDQKKMR